MDTETPFRGSTISQQWLRFLGSMPLAVTLLVVIAIASVIGTVVPQNQPYTNYIMQFGPFWFAVFNQLGIYDVYSAMWFIAIVAFLMVSTSVCLYRKTPNKWREATRFRSHIRVEALRRLHEHAEWLWSGGTMESALQSLTETLKAAGYQWHTQVQEGQQQLSAMKGRYHAFGYIFTHAAIVIISIGGLLDGTLWLKWKEWRGEHHLETRDVAAKDVAPASRLAPHTLPSFRGNIMVPEGSAVNFAFLRLRDGFFVQELPFSIALQKFTIAYHTTGQPKSFTSVVQIHDKEHLGDQPLEATIRVNHPLTYRGYTLYQSDFGDGGSTVHLQAWPITRGTMEPIPITGQINRTTTFTSPNGPLTIAWEDFRAINLLPTPKDTPSQRSFQHFGPSVTFTVRDAAGIAHTYLHYMSPVRIDGRDFFVSGSRTPSENDWNYVHIPVDPKGELTRFLRFNAKLRDMHGLQALLSRNTTPTDADNPNTQRDLIQVRLGLLGLFLQGGTTAVVEKTRTLVSPERFESAKELYSSLLRDTLANVFIELLREEGLSPDNGIQEREEAFFNDALATLSVLPDYGSPFYFQMTGFEQVQASGFQITYSSAAWIVYTGFALLIIGIYILFYTAHRQLWACVIVEPEGIRIVIAGTTQRAVDTFVKEFADMTSTLQKTFGPTILSEDKSHASIC